MNLENIPHDDSEAPLVVPIQVDLYGIKAKVVARPSPDEPPNSWQDVWKRVQISLMRIATEPLALFADIFSAARNVVRGLGSLPDAVSARIAGAHKLANESERDARKSQDTGTPVNGPAAFDELQSLIMQLRANGISAGLQRLPDGRLTLLLVRPEHECASAELLAATLPEDELADVEAAPDDLKRLESAEQDA